jgi:hypothetical protein
MPISPDQTGEPEEQEPVPFYSTVRELLWRAESVARAGAEAHVGVDDDVADELFKTADKIYRTRLDIS